MNRVNNNRSIVRNIAWVMGGIVVLAFISGVMVDIDHPIAWLLGNGHGRFLHPYFALAGTWAIGLGIILGITCLCRLAFLRLLKK